MQRIFVALIAGAFSVSYSGGCSTNSSNDEAQTERPSVTSGSDVSAEELQEKLETISNALHQYHDAKDAFPTRAINSPEGKPLLSWRVAILPMLGEQELYDRFNLNEPWDSPGNLPLVQEMPIVYAFGPNGDDGETTVFGASGNGTVFADGAAGVKIRHITDSTFKTVHLLIGAPSRAVIWSQPADLSVFDHEALEQLHENRWVCLVSGEVTQLTGELTTEQLGAACTFAGRDADALGDWRSKPKELTQIEKTKNSISHYYKTLMQYCLFNNGEYPTGSSKDVAALLTGNQRGKPFLDSQPVDAWGVLLNYEFPDKRNAESDEPRVWSSGPDKTNDNGDGDDISIPN